MATMRIAVGERTKFNPDVLGSVTRAWREVAGISNQQRAKLGQMPPGVGLRKVSRKR